MASLQKVVAFSDKFLRLAEIADFDHAVNGLQVENSGEFTKIGAAVDASTRTLQEAAAQKINLLIVHHGLFWAGLKPVSGPLYRQLRLAFDHNIAVYSAHLPLDLHPKVGNNAQLATALGLTSTKPWLEYKGTPIGLIGRGRNSCRELVKQLEKAVAGPIQSFCYGPKRPRAIAVVTGGAGGEIHRAAEAGVDTFITGEAPHWAAVAAQELGINLLLGGHYATETFGVKAFAALLAKRFSTPWIFIDCPTGL
jgi:dinuclear metal center YbgI/SA1388 family protein